MKIGILTWYFGINYGARAHSLALYQTVRNLGYDCEFIQYTSSNTIKKEFYTCTAIEHRHKHPIQTMSGLVKMHKFNQQKKQYPVSKKVYTAEEIDALGYDSKILDVKLLQMVKLIRDGEEVKMSKRTGQTITINELVEEVGLNASRYFFAAKSLDTQMNFDITLATKKSTENPVYYIEYAYARICSILNNVKEKIEVNNYETIESEYALNLIKKAYEFKDVVEMSAEKQIPHILTNYVYELATLFHTYYSHEKIISDDIKYTSERINLINAVKITIGNALNLIGIVAREKM